MVSVEKIINKFVQLDEYLAIIDEMRIKPRETFLGDKILMGSAKYYLQVSIECCLDIANHIIAAEGFRAPRDYADSFKILEERDVLDGETGMRLRQMAKFRNMLVHLYGDVDNSYVYEFMNKDIQDILDFKKIISVKFLAPPETNRGGEDTPS